MLENMLDEMEAIVLLIQRGANIFTTDNFSRSIFDVAYDCNHNGGFPQGGYRGDLWDAALAQCGYDKYIREPEDRVCHYTWTYTKEGFGRLWKGREHLCPYFSYSPVLCPYSKVLGESEVEEQFSELETSEDESDELP